MNTTLKNCFELQKRDISVKTNEGNKRNKAIQQLKARVCYFLSNFYFSQNDSSLKTMKNVFLFHLKSSFRSWDIKIFLFLSSTFFLPLSHCLRGWSKINLKDYDTINCLNKNLKTHFARYLEKEKRYGIKTLFIDRILNKSENVHQKLVPDLLFYFGK